MKMVLCGSWLRQWCSGVNVALVLAAVSVVVVVAGNGRGC